MLQAPFIEEVDAFLKRHGMSATRFGQLAVNNGHFLRKLGEGSVTVKTCNKAKKFMSQYEQLHPTLHGARSSGIEVGNSPLPDSGDEG